jgi:hypothetical protein
VKLFYIYKTQLLQRLSSGVFNAMELVLLDGECTVSVRWGDMVECRAADLDLYTPMETEYN